jgi:hypothetical protein
MSAWYILKEYSAIGEEILGGSQSVIVCAAYDGAVLRHPVGNPKRKVWGSQQQVSLSCETKVIEPVGESQTSEGDAC